MHLYKAEHLVTEGDSTLGGGHPVQYTDLVLQKSTPEPYYLILLTNVTPNKFNKK